jgi:hypothetical protein
MYLVSKRHNCVELTCGIIMFNLVTRLVCRSIYFWFMFVPPHLYCRRFQHLKFKDHSHFWYPYADWHMKDLAVILH